MAAYPVHKEAYDAVNHSIFVIGPGRTGSTLSGRIVQSFRGIEYAYEPAFLHSLIPMVARLATDDFRLLFETYLYEDVFMGLVTGRSWNFNKSDESSILKVKSETEINERINVSMGKLKAMEKARRAVLAFKLTDVVPFVRKLKALYPGMRFVVTHREAPGCLSSLLKKEWFSDATLKSVGLVWNGTFENGYLHPHWLSSAARPRWVGMTELERAALYYREMYSSLDGVGGLYVFSYDRLIREPKAAIGDLATWIGAEFSEGTEGIIGSVRDNSVTDLSLLDALPAVDRAETMKFSDSRELAKRIAR